MTDAATTSAAPALPDDRSGSARATDPPTATRRPPGSMGRDNPAPRRRLDLTTRRLVLGGGAVGTIAPLVVAARWAVVVGGMIFASRAAFDGDVNVVITLAACLFLTTWRTVLPLQLGRPGMPQLAAAFDVVAFALAAGVSAGPQSPFVGVVIVAIGVATFGWGVIFGAGMLILGWAGMWLTSLIAEVDMRPATPAFVAAVTASGGAVVLAAFVRERLIDFENRRVRTSGQLDALIEANQLLSVLNRVARSLPVSLDQREALENARLQITTTFRPQVVCVLEYDGAHEEWVPKVAEGAVLRPSTTLESLPRPLRMALANDAAILVADLGVEPGPGIAPAARSGMYAKLMARGRTVGLIAVEHPVAGRYNERDRRLLDGLAEVIALTLDNARSYSRLRSLGAEEERIRIARELHDRLGQWLTYISLELERIIGEDDRRAGELTVLYTDVQAALDELRETIRQLRSGISDGNPLARVGRQVIERFADRTAIDAHFHVTDGGAALPIPVENELLRILQESLTNIDRHAHATNVEVSWDVRDGRGVLTIADNGIGFDPNGGVRDHAYGLIGMRERADVIGARIHVSSSPGAGTTVTVTVGPPSSSAQKES